MEKIIESQQPLDNQSVKCWERGGQVHLLRDNIHSLRIPKEMVLFFQNSSIWTQEHLQKDLSCSSKPWYIRSQWGSNFIDQTDYTDWHPSLVWLILQRKRGTHQLPPSSQQRPGFSFPQYSLQPITALILACRANSICLMVIVHLFIYLC